MQRWVVTDTLGNMIDFTTKPLVSYRLARELKPGQRLTMYYTIEQSIVVASKPAL